MGDRLATTDTGRRTVVPLSGGGELGPHLTQCGLGPGRGLPLYQVVYLDPTSCLHGHNRHGLNIGGSVPFLGAAVSPTNNVA